MYMLPYPLQQPHQGCHVHEDFFRRKIHAVQPYDRLSKRLKCWAKRNNQTPCLRRYIGVTYVLNVGRQKEQRGSYCICPPSPSMTHHLLGRASITATTNATASFGLASSQESFPSNNSCNTRQIVRSLNDPTSKELARHEGSTTTPKIHDTMDQNRRNPQRGHGLLQTLENNESSTSTGSIGVRKRTLRRLVATIKEDQMSPRNQ